MNKKIIILIILFGFVIHIALAQESNNNSSHRRNLILVSSITGSTLFFGSVSYISYFENTEHTRFHFYNDNKGYLQIDKFIHSYGSYMASSVWYKGLLKIGIEKKKALLLVGMMGSVPFTPKEIFDGFSEGTGFSWGDMLANTIGPAFFVSQQILFDEQILKYKFSFSRSDYAGQANGYLGKTLLQNYFRDYNGHTYWLSINANKIFLKTKLPDWISISAGYSANGMFGLYENINSYNGVRMPEIQRYRQYLLSLDIDWSKIRTKSKFVRIIFNGMNFIKIPFPTIEVNSKGQINGHWIYF